MKCTRKQYKELKKIGWNMPPEKKVIEHLTNFLIAHCYKPHPEFVIEIDREKLKKYNLLEEPINWSSLCCMDVVKEKNKYIVFIEEAHPECKNFKKYIKYWLEKWGWKVKVMTEW